MMQFDLLVSLLFKKIAMPSLAAHTFYPPRYSLVLNQKAHFAVFSCDVAHKLKQKIVLADG
jgi:hypothetical protein